jgi:hypothetical protein
MMQQGSGSRTRIAAFGGAVLRLGGVLRSTLGGLPAQRREEASSDDPLPGGTQLKPVCIGTGLVVYEGAGTARIDPACLCQL